MTAFIEFSIRREQQQNTEEKKEDVVREDWGKRRKEGLGSPSFVLSPLSFPSSVISIFSFPDSSALYFPPSCYFA